MALTCVAEIARRARNERWNCCSPIREHMNTHAFFKSRAEQAPLSTALLGNSRSPLNYAELLRQIENTAKELCRLSITRGDRVALVLPNGPESAVACFSIAAAATCAPL